LLFDSVTGLIISYLDRRMQRVLHSILTGRILLNLREAASRDREKVGLTKNASAATSFTDGETGARPTLSSIVIGVDSWFRDTGINAQSMTDQAEVA